MLRSDFRGATGVSRAGLVGQPSRLLAWLHDEIGLLYLGGFGPVAEEDSRQVFAPMQHTILRDPVFTGWDR